jgi:hypothetical protein
LSFVVMSTYVPVPPDDERLLAGEVLIRPDDSASARVG